METIVGFVIGYLVGVREGPDGLDRVRTSVQAIRESPQVRELAAEGLAFVEPIVKQVLGGGGSSVVHGVLDAVVHRGTAALNQVRA